MVLAFLSGRNLAQLKSQETLREAFACREEAIVFAHHRPMSVQLTRY